MTDWPTSISGTYTAPSPSAINATRRPQSWNAISPINATIPVPTNAFAIRAASTRVARCSKPPSLYTPARKNGYAGGRNAVGRPYDVANPWPVAIETA